MGGRSTEAGGHGAGEGPGKIRVRERWPQENKLKMLFILWSEIFLFFSLFPNPQEKLPLMTSVERWWEWRKKTPEESLQGRDNIARCYVKTYQVSWMSVLYLEISMQIWRALRKHAGFHKYVRGGGKEEGQNTKQIEKQRCPKYPRTNRIEKCKQLLPQSHRKKGKYSC